MAPEANAPVRLLEGYRALDLTDLKGQMCGKILRDLGMEVLKVEPPEGDPVRRLGPFKDDEPGLENSLRFAFLNSGKKSITLDLRSDEGRGAFLGLVERVDVLLESWMPGELERLGLGAEVLRARNPRLVITSVTGFGQDGPYRDFLASDIVGFAMGGLMYISGDPSYPPLNAPEMQANYFASVHAAYGTLLALWQRGKDDVGRSVDVSVQEGVASQEHLIRVFGVQGHSMKRQGSQHEHVAPSNLFPTKDGWVNLFVSRPHWRRFLEFWEDHPAELDDPRWDENRVRRASADWLNPLVAEFTKRFDKDEFVRLMQERGIPCLALNTPREFLSDEHVRARGVIGQVHHPALGDYEQVAFPGVFDGEKMPVERPPLLGEHTAEVLRSELGLSAEDVQSMFAQKHV